MHSHFAIGRSLESEDLITRQFPHGGMPHGGMHGLPGGMHMHSPANGMHHVGRDDELIRQLRGGRHGHGGMHSGGHRGPMAARDTDEGLLFARRGEVHRGHRGGMHHGGKHRGGMQHGGMRHGHGGGMKTGGEVALREIDEDLVARQGFGGHLGGMHMHHGGPGFHPREIGDELLARQRFGGRIGGMHRGGFHRGQVAARDVDEELSARQGLDGMHHAGLHRGEVESRSIGDGSVARWHSGHFGGQLHPQRRMEIDGLD